ncbi:MAG: NusG domain II-containing protein [Oscillospiraceae bacterium]|nr:NusG domain II-containing protein [Oscillospiraceae bacterium]
MSLKSSPPECRPNRRDALAALAIALAALVIALIYYIPAETASLQVSVSVDGRVEEFAPLSRYAGVHTYSHNGYTLTVSCDGATVQVVSANCPGQDCVHTGAVSKAGQSIVCLPARIVIRLSGGAADLTVG